MKKISLLIPILFIYSFNIVFAQPWVQVGIDIDGEAAGDRSGAAVSLSPDGKRVAIGAWLNDGIGNKAGHVRIYSESGGVWTQVGNEIDGEATEDVSGYSVSLSSDGKRVAIGARDNDGTGTNAGHVRIYSESGGEWTQVGSDINGEAAGDNSGCSVSLSSDGKRVAIGASENTGTNTYAGHVRVYSESGGEWTQVGSDIDGEAAGDRSGNSVSLSSDGKRVAIGAYENAGAGLYTYAGHVRIYSESGGEWTQVGGDIDAEAVADRFGWSVSISHDGKRVAIGAYVNDGNGIDAGHVRVYSESGGIWTQVGDDIDGEAADDRSGYSVSLSFDGSRVAIGALNNDGIGNNAGHVRVFSESGGVWTQLGSDIDGEAIDDYSGCSVSMSSDGNRIAIGAQGNDGTFYGAGHVRIYIDETALTLVDNELFDSLPMEFMVLSAYPNPFNPSTTIRYGLADNNRISIQIYDITGKLITTLLNEEQTPGWHSIIWNGINQHNEQVPTGLYLSRIVAGNEIKTTKLMLLK